MAFGQIPYIGKSILVVGIVAFAFSTTLGWAYYGESCAKYLGGMKIIIPYRILYVASVAIAPLITLQIVWSLADTFNALMAIPNLIAVLLLSNVIKHETDIYIKNIGLKSQEEPPTITK